MNESWKWKILNESSLAWRTFFPMSFILSLWVKSYSSTSQILKNHKKKYITRRLGLTKIPASSRSLRRIITRRIFWLLSNAKSLILHRCLQRRWHRAESSTNNILEIARQNRALHKIIANQTLKRPNSSLHRNIRKHFFWKAQKSFKSFSKFTFYIFYY